MYCYNQMSPDERVKFMEWYDEHKFETFNFRKEIDEYCRSDVDILRRCCLKFREEFISTNKTDPFTFVTIASACMGVYTSLHMKENTMSVMPPNGYVNNTNASEIAAQWIAYMEKKRQLLELFLLLVLGKCIQSSQRDRGEIKIRGYFVDGYQPEEKIIYEFHGCFYHGCDICFHDASIHPLYNRPMWAIKRETLRKEFELNQAGYVVVSIWEHDFIKLKKEDKGLQEFLLTFKAKHRLNPRDAFYGGRTGAATLYHCVEGNEKIKYIDFTSLYPYVNKYCAYPVGHPEIILENFESIEKYFGLIYCKILPPRSLFHPVLPFKSNGKLVFGLCLICITTRNQSVCDHTEDERCLEGTWTTLEISKALECGYELKEIFEIYNFKEQSTDLFRSYIDTFLKIKQEASGWPAGCENEEEKLQYIEDYFTREGIQLDFSKIGLNPGQRSLSKLMLNSLWGKFGQDQDKLQTVFVSTLAEFNNYFADKKNEIHNVSFPTDEIALMQYKIKKEYLGSNPETNLFIAAFTTSHARLKLYSEIEKLGEKVLYYDTDSIIYISDETNDPPLGNYLGEFTNELPAGDYITEFVSAGPKNYAYKTCSGKTACKIRGFTLNFENSQILNFSTLRDVVTENERGTLVTLNPRKISRDLKGARVVNRREEKRYKFNFDKRVILEDFKTYPYGY
ncbi:uncharacterized protein [Parasteatoda tepidariorum]|uniref:uncharacterized protein n=1 Tax=Parasteatoda tepidariorum TaxID=114398 RepID=UPI0039BD5D95